MTSFRFVPCPFCHGAKFVIATVDDLPEASGCIPCGGNWNEFGSGRIGVTFEHDPRVAEALSAHSGKDPA